ncbi:MAG: glycosyltransferase family 4 protein [Candidatus Omnitrophica bacterium]|nr:glycosyltransferase family 4 protein [Candidatus Omnitrophota bacterium]
MDIVLLTHFFSPDIQATSQLFSELAEDLAKKYNLTVICGRPLICLKEVDNCRQDYHSDSFRVIRLPSMSLSKKTFTDRILNHLSFIISAFFYCLIHRFLKFKKTKLFIYSSDNPLNFIVSLIFFNRPRLYLCQDLFYAQGLSAGIFKAGGLGRLLGFLEKIALISADKIAAISIKMKDHITDVFGIQKDKIAVISNWSDTERIFPFFGKNPFSEKYGLANKFVVMYSGRMGYLQDLELLLSSAKDLSEFKDICFVFLGDGIKKNKLILLAEKTGLKNVIFLPYHCPKEANLFFSAASVSMVIHKGNFSHCSLPSKIYNILSSGRPVIATADSQSSVCDIITRAQSGIVVEPGNQKQLSSAILSLYRDKELCRKMGCYGRIYAVNNFSRIKITEKYNLLIEKMIS